MAPPESEPEAADAQSQRILCVTRGEVVEVFRIRVLPGDAASLERYENGEFLPARVFSIVGAEGASAQATESIGAPLERAIRRALTYLDGSVSVGERDLLSPTSAMTRNLRWFPGDIQMLGTSFHYLRQLFPSAQFHVGQLFRRVFGDVAFLGLIVFSSAGWLRTRGHAGLATLALALQVASIVAIIGFDRFWEPIRYRFQRARQVRAPHDGLRGTVELVGIVCSQAVHGLAAVIINTLVGLTNLLIHPVKVVQSFQKVRRGKSLEWKASSVSAGQDMRGWPVADFLEAYGFPACVGLGMLAFLTWLIVLGAPLDLFGLNSVGLFLASFLSAWFYAWYTALPHSAEDGVPRYQLSRGEFWGLTLVGLAGLTISLTLYAVGLYPMPAFESSSGVVALFLSATCAFAALFPSYYSLKQRYARKPTFRSNRHLRRVSLWLALGGALALSLALLSPHTLRDRCKRFFIPDKARFRMSPAERDVYLAVSADLKRARVADPEPLLNASGTQLTLGATNPGPQIDARPLQGLPSPRLKRLVRRDQPQIPELYPLPMAERIPSNVPRRDFVLPTGEKLELAGPTAVERSNALLEARRRARAMAPRVLTAAELAEQAQFLARADFPWISREELERLGSSDALGARLPLLEMARVHRFEEIKALWEKVPAAQSGDPANGARFARLLDGIDGAVSLGLEPDAEHVQDFVALQQEVATRWPREFPNVPLGALHERLTGTPSSPFLVARYARLHRQSFDELARELRLDYVDWAWQKPPIAPSVRRVFRDRVGVEARDRLELDWGDSDEAKLRFEDLQTEQLVASKIMRATRPSAQASPALLAEVLRLVEGAIAGTSQTPPHGLSAALAQNFDVDGVLPSSDRPADATSKLLRARLWTQTMSRRVGLLAQRLSDGSPLPGNDPDRALLMEISKLRFPDDAGDPNQRLALEWLVLIDASETQRELVDGYRHYERELAGRGYAKEGLTAPAPPAPEEQWQDLLRVWRELPLAFANIPARADQVAEFVCQTAYFSSADGKHARTVAGFLRDFQDLFAEVNRLMPEAPPPLIQELSDAAMLKARGRLSQSPEARRFFAWWHVVEQARVVRYNFERHRLNRAVDPRELALSWAEITRSGLSRFPHLPWRVPGFAEYFTNLRELSGLELPALWRRFERQLNHANSLSMNHVAPSVEFESLVERRITARTGSPTFDPRTRRANAVLALAELSDTATANRLHFKDADATRLSTLLARLYESVSRSYPNLYWEGEGTLESYTLLALVNGFQLQRTLTEFAPEWSLANGLAEGGLLERLSAIAEREPNQLGPQDRALRAFVATQTQRIQEKTGLRPASARSAAMNALIALSNLLLGAGEEGLLPSEGGEAWSKSRVRQWATLHGAHLDAATTSFAVRLGAEFGELITSMRAEGPHFRWEDGAIVETELLVAESSKVSLEALRAARRETWRTASDLVEQQVSAPRSFARLIEQDARAELVRKLAVAHGVTPERVPEAEVRSLEDSETLPQTAILALAEVLAQIRTTFGQNPAPTAIADAYTGARKEGPARYPHVPWAAKGFVASLLVAAQRADFHGDVWRYAEFIELPLLNELLGEGDGNGSSAAARLPADVLDDMRTIMRQQTGRTPSSDPVLAFQALHDGLFLLKEFVPELQPSRTAATALVQVRARVRALAERFPVLHIVAGDDHSLRVGFADRLAAIATRQALRSGSKVDDPAFADVATDLLERQFLRDLSHIYELVRRSFPSEELDYYKQAIQRDAISDNTEKAKRNGLTAGALSVPHVEDDDVVADFALYELLYAREIGQTPAYVVSVFEIYDELRARADVQASYQNEITALDREAQGLGLSNEAASRASPEYADWWQKRGDFMKRSRGKLISLSRTFALLKEAAFSPAAPAQARAAFARFGNFQQYLRSFFDDLTLVQRTPSLSQALASLAERDQFLADGVEFAIAQFKLHVLDRAYPSVARNAEVMRQLAAFLPKVNDDYRAALGFVPGLESGVPFYDSLNSFARADVQATAGTDVLRRLNVMQRGLQSWTQTYFLKQAYEILFDRELDEEDETPLPTELQSRGLGKRTLGDAVHEFLETKLPERLTRETGNHDPSSWLRWLMENGELDLAAQSRGKNPYAEAVSSYETRLSNYRERVRAGEASGKNVRAERQRVRDLELEYASLQRRVSSLESAATRQADFSSKLSRDYREAIWQSVLWLIGLLAFVTLARGASRRLSRPQEHAQRWLGVAGIVAFAALGWLPFWVAADPLRAERVAGRPLHALRLIEANEDGSTSARGVAAQLDRTRPWTVLATYRRQQRSER